jgi:hypothetical protein
VLPAGEILGAWERGRGRPLGELAVELLGVAGHPGPPETVPVGERDATILELRTCMFGPAIAALATCPACGAELDVELGTDDVRRAGGGGGAPPLVIEDGGWPRLRLPTAADLVAAGAAPDVDAVRDVLLRRCVLDGDAAGLDPSAAEAIESRLAAADPGASIDVALECPSCEHAWTLPFDIVSFFWTEVDALARRLLRDVHVLASAYGWPERDVLELSEPRRAAYLELVTR